MAFQVRVFTLDGITINNFFNFTNIFSDYLGATDIMQPIDAGYGYVFKKLIARCQNEWLENENNIDLWLGNDGKKLTAADRRILITQWAGEAAEILKGPDYDHFRWRCFEKTGMLLTADGSGDDKVNPEGLKNFQVMESLPMKVNSMIEIETPEPKPDPSDEIVEDELFTTTENEVNLDLNDLEEDRVDLESDRVYNHKLKGQKIRGLYETGWHTGTVEYFNTKLEEYCVSFDDNSEDYIKESDIDGEKIILVSEMSRVSGRIRAQVDYRKMSGL